MNMLLLIVLALVIAVVVAAVCLAFVGRKLELFSSTKLEETPLLRMAPIRWVLYVIIGFTWVLAKIHFPGVELSVTYGFDNQLGHVLRAAYWKCRVHHLGKDVIIDVGAKATCWKNVTIGDNSWIDRNVIFETGTIDKDKFNVCVRKTSTLVKEGELRIGSGCHVSKNVVIQSHGGVLIGDYTGIASGVEIYSLSHHYRNSKNKGEKDSTIYKFSPLAPIEEQSLLMGSVILEGSNAIGLNSVVLPGATIGKNSWIGVCSSVIDDIPPDCVATGCPAKVTKKIR